MWHDHRTPHRRPALYRRDLDHRDVVWRDVSGHLPIAPPGDEGVVNRAAGREAAQVIEVLVDGAFTLVHGQQADRVILERVIEDLQYLVTQLDKEYPEHQSRGRCLEFGDWGRCYSSACHDSDHKFPTEEDRRGVQRAAGRKV